MSGNKARPEKDKDAFVQALKKSILEILSDPQASRRDKTQAIATAAKLLQIEHRISPGEEGDFFG